MGFGLHQNRKALISQQKQINENTSDNSSFSRTILDKGALSEESNTALDKTQTDITNSTATDVPTE